MGTETGVEWRSGRVIAARLNRQSAAGGARLTGTRQPLARLLRVKLAEWDALVTKEPRFGHKQNLKRRDFEFVKVQSERPEIDANQNRVALRMHFANRVSNRVSP